MKLLQFILKVTFLLYFCFLTDFGEAQHTGERLEKEVDKILADLRWLMTSNNIDAIPLPSDEDNLTATLFGKELNGHVWVGDGQIKGISSIHRTGNISFGKDPDDPTANQFQLAVGLTNLQGKCSSSFKLGPFSSNFGIALQISSCSLDVTILPSSRTLKTCQLNTSRSYKVTLQGIGFLDTKLDSMLIDTVAMILQPVIHDKVQGVVCHFLESTLARWDSPFFDKLITDHYKVKV